MLMPSPIWKPLVQSWSDLSTGTEYVNSMRTLGVNATDSPPPTEARGAPHRPPHSSPPPDDDDDSEEGGAAAAAAAAESLWQ